MKLERLVPSVLLIGFSAFTAAVVLRDGYTEWLHLALSHLSAAILLVDLSIALSLVMFWMVGDARARGATVWPFAVLTLLLGSVGPLAYLVVRSFGAASSSNRGSNDAEKRGPRGLGLERDQPLA